MRQPFIFLCILSLLVAKATTACAKGYTWRTIPLKKTYIYRLYLNDKTHSPYSIEHPENYLSERAINRRKRQGIAIDSTDLPVSPTYINEIKAKGLTIMGTSRWHNTITVASTTDDVARVVKGLPCVKSCLRLYKSPDSLVVLKKESTYKKCLREECGKFTGYQLLSSFWLKVARTDEDGNMTS